ncbi:hypothetical protein QBC38DRAFT_229165 [Podospora fimiseda]|uniref:Uncharacterized protein n=1 Tax=Podospora fimiseda TaxID=252190 RepID=A0AAN7GX49_9PEZI|nr:hypothetical protein QBC38DRAFT_229165 [Podospora fimiseda]
MPGRGVTWVTQHLKFHLLLACCCGAAVQGLPSIFQRLPMPRSGEMKPCLRYIVLSHLSEATADDFWNLDFVFRFLGTGPQNVPCFLFVTRP